MSSSPRAAEPLDGWIDCRGQATGPIRMPLKDPLAFVAQFSRVYASIGLRVSPIARPEDADPPATDVQAAAGGASVAAPWGERP